MEIILKDIIDCFESLAPIYLQEDYDNSGLQLGEPSMTIGGILLTIDITSAVIQEAITKNCNLIIAHHPLIFQGIKRITNGNDQERAISKAIQNNIAVYVCHTNLDNAPNGVSFRLAQKIGLTHCKVLAPLKNMLCKLVVFVPDKYAQSVRDAIFSAGGGVIGNYDSCSFNLKGEGSFRAGEGTQAFVGKRDQLHLEPETRIETIIPEAILSNVIHLMLKAHPYEEVAYDVYPLNNNNPYAGSGVIGELPNEMSEITFLHLLKEKLAIPALKYSNLLGRDVKRIAICGGSGFSFFKEAIRKGADLFLTADIKYHQYFEAEGKIILVDGGHFETEQFTKDIFYDILNKKFPNFAPHFSEVITNPINYLK